MKHISKMRIIFWTFAIGDLINLLLAETKVISNAFFWINLEFLVAIFIFIMMFEFLKIK